MLSGVCRFDVVEELSTTRGYRLVRPDWSRFADDYLDHDYRLDNRHQALIDAVKQFFDAKGYEADMAMLEKLPASRLVDSLTMALPFSNQEKQMLLETVEAETRLENFVALVNGEFEVPDSVTRH